MPVAKRWSIGFAAFAVIVGSIAATASAAPKDATAELLSPGDLQPGKVAKITDPLTGGLGYWMIYVPTDYVPTRKWPLIFYYHGLNCDPTVSPIKELTNGKGYIIVGLDYMDHEARVPQVERNVPNIKRIHDVVAKKLQVDEKLLFLSGGSQGGFRTCDYGEATLDTWAGLIVLLSGRGIDAMSHPERNPKYGGKPIFIGDGEKDDNLVVAKEAAAFYQSRGANVTMEVFPGLGHDIDANNAALKHWLVEHGPMTIAKTNLALARSAEKSGKLGQAYVLYQSVAKDCEPGAMADSAKAGAASIADGAEKLLKSAEAAITAAKYSEGIKTLAGASATYSESEWGDKAKARLAALHKDPAIQSQIEQATIDASADDAERLAVAAEKAGDFKQAIAGYQAYVEKYPRSHRIAAVRDHLKSLQGDSKIQSAIVSKQADANCKTWLSMAHTYVENGAPDRARTYLQKIIDQYPGTSYAATAARELADLK